MIKIFAWEEDLRSALLAGHTSALSDRIADREVFTGPGGSLLDKAQDLALHASGMPKVGNFDATDLLKAN